MGARLGWLCAGASLTLLGVGVLTVWGAGRVRKALPI